MQIADKRYILSLSLTSTICLLLNRGQNDNYNKSIARCRLLNAFRPKTIHFCQNMVIPSHDPVPFRVVGNPFPTI